MNLILFALGWRSGSPLRNALRTVDGFKAADMIHD